jgi:hypothetical protein
MDVCGLTSHHLLVSCQIISAQNMASALATSCTAQAPTQHRHFQGSGSDQFRTGLGYSYHN